MLARVGGAPVHDLAAIDAVAQQMIERAAAEGAAAKHAAGGEDTLLAADALSIKVDLQLGNTAECEIALEDQPDHLGLRLIHDESALAHVIAERNGPTHPHALAAGSCELVADALTGNLPLELGKRQQDIEGEATHRGCCVELLSDRDERHAMGLKQLDQLGEV